MRCISTVTYSFIVNGEPRGRIVPSCGLRQGDSISPYLFLLCAEVLSRCILLAEQRDLLHGVEICVGAPSISHLFFADDSFIFFKAERGECVALKNILHEYECASGQQVNYQKICISFSKNVDRALQDELADTLGVVRVEKHDKYLGLPMELSYSKEAAFSYLNEKIRNRTQGWREKTLSVAGKEILIKAVAQAIPSYVMNCFELPKHLCEEMHRLMARFWWGGDDSVRKIHWVSWKKLCSSKNEGAEVKGGDSYTWRSIISGREVLKKGLRFQVGDGRSISVWLDPWVPLPFALKPYSPLMEGTKDFTVADLIDEGGREWVMELLEELSQVMKLILLRSFP
ncbi:uncharacterized protein LOC133737251 [Rosa rugosa]|uniref:uncharacterized protein LOC133737251 n=1 Tax=Rosa rugosa TaxID=74645 RepID=UPI002B40FB9A|nr:uncharacterized protein LOC133737251 [Rosa rugosa]